MMFLLLSVVTSFLIFDGTNAALPSPVVGSWFVNWAQYRPEPYNMVPQNLTGIIDKINVLWYGFAYFCPNSSMFQPYWVYNELTECNNGAQPFELTWVEPKDTSFWQQVVDFKTANADLKIILSVGGWNFPSNFYSQMVSSEESRATFIQSVVQTLVEYDLDGIDFDWEYPASYPRMNYVEIFCDEFHNVSDYGGTYNNAKADNEGLVALASEMRQAFIQLNSDKEYYITICGQANLTNAERGFDVKALSQYVDAIQIMTYDYSVPATTSANESLYTAPNMPLYEPTDHVHAISPLNINQTVHGYIEMGMPADQLVLGLAFYGHTWYVPGMELQTEWTKFGLESTRQHSCCGPMNATWGAQHGTYTKQCGQYAYNEIINAGFDTYFDPVTRTTFGYMRGEPADNYTIVGTWITYQSIETYQELVTFAHSLGLAGTMGFDITQDTFDVETNTWTFDVTNAVYNTTMSLYQSSQHLKPNNHKNPGLFKHNHKHSHKHNKRKKGAKMFRKGNDMRPRFHKKD